MRVLTTHTQKAQVKIDIIDLAGTFNIPKNKPILKARKKLEKNYKRI